MGLLDDIIDTVTGGDGGGGGGSGGGGGGGGSGGSGLSLPGWLTDLKDVKDTLLVFGRSPLGFILGAVLSTLLNGVELMVEAVVDAVRFVILGSDGVPSATGTLGFADLPVFGVSVLTDGGSIVAEATISVARTISEAAVSTAAIAGPLAPVVYAVVVAAALVATAWTLRTLISILADAVPGLQGVIK